MREYEYRGSTYQFADGEVPDGARLVEAKQAEAPANKARTVKPGRRASDDSDGGRVRGK